MNIRFGRKNEFTLFVRFLEVDLDTLASNIDYLINDVAKKSFVYVINKVIARDYRKPLKFCGK